ncbi:MAG TPA: hypothetical protein VL691_24235 [Vicinamibacteria bacterium]|nr:hypothetical protein [Vicinamibacteria bacterium]
MRSFVRLSVAALAVLCLGGAPAAAHDHCGTEHHCCPACSHGADCHGGCPGCASPSPDAGRVPNDTGPTNSGYDLDTVTVVRGTVASVTVAPARGAQPGGTHVSLQNEGTVMEVHLGPTWFLDREGVELSRGDALEVTGSVVDLGGATVMIARDVKKGQNVVRLRDEQGLPLWAGRSRPR